MSFSINIGNSVSFAIVFPVWLGIVQVVRAVLHWEDSEENDEWPGRCPGEATNIPSTKGTDNTWSHKPTIQGAQGSTHQGTSGLSSEKPVVDEWCFHYKCFPYIVWST